MNRYLLDTNICIYFMKGLYNLDTKIKEVGLENCFISEITLAELKFGLANSKRQEKNRLVLEKFLKGIQIIPIFHSLDFYAGEKTRLRESGKIIDEFDLLIASTAVTFDMIMVTNNRGHFSRVEGIRLEDWTEL